MHIFVLLLLSIMAVPSSDPLAGSWKADLAGSVLPSGFPELQSQTMELHFASGKLQCSTERVDRRGTKTHAFFAAAFDGKRYPVSGIPDILTVSVQRFSGYVEADFYSATKVVFSYRMQLARDGETLTIISIDPITRKPLHAKLIYRRDASGSHKGARVAARTCASLA